MVDAKCYCVVVGAMGGGLYQWSSGPMEHMRGGVQGSRGHNVGRVLQAQPRGIPVCRHEFGGG